MARKKKGFFAKDAEVAEVLEDAKASESAAPKKKKGAAQKKEKRDHGKDWQSDFQKHPKFQKFNSSKGE